MTAPFVLLTNPIDPELHRALAQRIAVRQASATDADTLTREARDASFVIVRAVLPEALFEQASLLRAVVRHGAGLDMIPMPAANRHAVAVANVPAVNAVSVAEYVVGQMIGLARYLTAIDNRMRHASWQVARRFADDATELSGKTVAIVGVGAIGLAVARICALGFGMRVLGVRRTPPPDTETIRYVALDDALPQADYVVLACPLDASTRGLIGAPRLARMKAGARLVNVSRGPVVDEAALADALRRGHIGGAALDVFTTQPLPADSPLHGLPNVLLSPHLAGLTQESMRRMSEVAVAQVLEMIDGQLPRHLVNVDRGDAIVRRWATLPPLA